MLEVKLVDSSSSPLNLAIATARTCYSSKGIVYPEEVANTPEQKKLRDAIAESTLKAGHLTTRQHISFTFAIKGLSRLAIWEFLHSHQFYNSEQVSQRYVQVKDDNFYIPSSLNSEGSYEYKSIQQSMLDFYKELIIKLHEPVSQRYYDIFPSRSKSPDKWKNNINKKVIEIARYVLPVSTTAYLYHTINALTLYRYAAACKYYHTGAELRKLVRLMIEEVRKIDPELVREIPEIESNEAIIPDWTKRSETINQEPVLLETNIDNLKLPNHSIIELLRDKHFSNTLNTAIMNPELRVLSLYRFTFSKTMSHTADSQNQRHRMTPAYRWDILDQFQEEDTRFIVPLVLQENPDFYSNGLKEVYKRITIFAKKYPREAIYLLPNAHPVAMIETGDLLSYYHKWKSRLCYTAQEEIFNISVKELQLVDRHIPGLSELLLAPCYMRKNNNVTPFCPEGKRFCGIPVWEKSIDEYKRTL